MTSQDISWHGQDNPKNFGMSCAKHMRVTRCLDKFKTSHDYNRMSWVLSQDIVKTSQRMSRCLDNVLRHCLRHPENIWDVSVFVRTSWWILKTEVKTSQKYQDVLNFVKTSWHVVTRHLVLSSNYVFQSWQWWWLCCDITLFCELVCCSLHTLYIQTLEKKYKVSQSDSTVSVPPAAILLFFFRDSEIFLALISWTCFRAAIACATVLILAFGRPKFHIKWFTS